MTDNSATRADVALIDDALGPYAEQIGDDLPGYRNHAVRMATFTLALSPGDAEHRTKVSAAAAFHDIGLWTAKTLDYLEPSVQPALRWLADHDRIGWSDEVTLMITEHHKIRAVKGQYPLVEAFRKADLCDFSMGRVRGGVPKDVVQAARTEHPNAGFHKTLVRKTVQWVPRHPLRPAPMLKW